MLSRKQKEDQFAKINDYFNRAKFIAAYDYQSISAKQTAMFRKKIAQNDANIIVFKNNLVFLNMKNLPKYDNKLEKFKGPSAYLFSFNNEYENIIQNFKETFSDQLKNMNFWFGYYDGEVQSGKDIKNIILLPEKSVLQSRLANCLNTIISQLAIVINKVADEAKGSLKQGE